MLKKVCEVFTKEYRQETQIQELREKNLEVFKLNNKCESIEEKVKRLSDVNFVSRFYIRMGRNVNG